MHSQLSSGGFGRDVRAATACICVVAFFLMTKHSRNMRSRMLAFSVILLVR